MMEATAAIKWIDVRREGDRFPGLVCVTYIGEVDDEGRPCPYERFCRVEGFVLTAEPDGVRVAPDATYFRRSRPSVLVPWSDVTRLACFFPEVES